MAAVLDLNQDWSPIASTSWDRALLLIMKGKVDIVLEHESNVLTYARGEIKMPVVVRLLKRVKYDRSKGLKFSRQNLFQRDKQTCQYCLKHVQRHEVTYDHVIPRSQGGKTEWTNIVICCQPCNSRKGGRTPKQAKMRDVYPTKPTNLRGGINLIYDPHMPFEWRQFFRDQTYWNGELEK